MSKQRSKQRPESAKSKQPRPRPRVAQREHDRNPVTTFKPLELPKHHTASTLHHNILLKQQRQLGNAFVRTQLQKGEKQPPARPVQPVRPVTSFKGLETITRQADPAVETRQPTWQAPFTGGVRTHGDAVTALARIARELWHLADIVDDDSAVGQLQNTVDLIIDQIMPHYEQNERARLTESEVGELAFTGRIAKMQYDAQINRFRQQFMSLLELFQVTPPDTAEQEAQLVEALHMAFIKNQKSRIGKISQALDQLQAYNDKVQKVGKWAGKIAGHLQRAKLASRIKQVVAGSKSVGDILGKVKDVVNVSKSLAILAGWDGMFNSEAMGTIAKFDAGLEIIDTTISTFAKRVPLLGQLWSNYYMPLTKACLQLVSIIAGYEDVQGRQWTYISWYEQVLQKQPQKPPQIPKKFLPYFPGGQAVFEYMWFIMQGYRLKPSSKVEAYFKNRYEIFSEATKGEGRMPLVADVYTGYNPFKWGDVEGLENLSVWAIMNKDHVWGTLYGRYLPPPNF